MREFKPNDRASLWELAEKWRVEAALAQDAHDTWLEAARPMPKNEKPLVRTKRTKLYERFLSASNRANVAFRALEEFVIDGWTCGGKDGGCSHTKS